MKDLANSKLAFVQAGFPFTTVRGKNRTSAFASRHRPTEDPVVRAVCRRLLHDQRSNTTVLVLNIDVDSIPCLFAAYSHLTT